MEELRNATEEDMNHAVEKGYIIKEWKNPSSTITIPKPIRFLQETKGIGISGTKSLNESVRDLSKGKEK